MKAEAVGKKKLPAVTENVGRRAACATLISGLAVPFACSAALGDDEAALAKEKQVIKDLDRQINSAREQAMKDELTILKDNDKYVEALKKGDVEAQKKIRAEVAALEADEKANAAKAVALRAQEEGEVAAERTLEGKVSADKKALAQKAEEAYQYEAKALDAALEAKSKK